jgi:hypothetical protein
MSLNAGCDFVDACVLRGAHVWMKWRGSMHPADLDLLRLASMCLQRFREYGLHFVRINKRLSHASAATPLAVMFIFSGSSIATSE